jgi:hypothetical protein
LCYLQFSATDRIIRCGTVVTVARQQPCDDLSQLKTVYRIEHARGTAKCGQLEREKA